MTSILTIPLVITQISLASLGGGLYAHAEQPLLKLGTVDKRVERATSERWLEKCIQNLSFTETGKRLLSTWKAESKSNEKPLIVNLVPMINDRAWAGEEGAVAINSDHLSGPLELAALLSHEWLGHKMDIRILRRLTGEEYFGVDDELVSRVRGWRVWLELNPDALQSDRDLEMFLTVGPRRYWQALTQPDRLYALDMTVKDIGNPEAFYTERIKAIKAWLRTHEENSVSLEDIESMQKGLKESDTSFRAAYGRAFDNSYRHDVAKANLKMARGLQSDKKVMTKYRRIAKMPEVIALTRDWDAEIMDFCNWARPRIFLKPPCP